MALDKQTIDTLLTQAVSDGTTPGTAAMVADRSGLLYEQTAGVATLGGDAPFTVDTPQYIASMSKAITSTACMMLVERGQLSLDTTAADVLPWAANPQVLEGFDENGEPRLRAARSSPTLKQLLTHTGGYSYEIWNADVLRYQEKTGTPGVLAAAQGTVETALVADPGTQWEYGLNISVAGLMAAEVTGRDLGELLRELLFDPLGMDETCFILSDDQKRRMASLHARGPDGQLEVFPLIWEQDPQIKLGGEALYGTPADYMRFLRMLVNDGLFEGRRLLSRDTMALMAGNQMGDLNVRPMRTAMPPLSNDTDFYPGMPQKWGLSFLINTQDSPEGRPAGSLSWAGLCNSYYWIDRSNGITGALFNQVMPFFDPACVGLFRAFETEVYRGLAAGR
ncbi:MAG: 1,4-butanediol diacrylate esterase [Salinisphaeraceae bacterium]|nr:1,4-butanediol diacrylate esterase [Salinisphaeraceae bacterium]